MVEIKGLRTTLDQARGAIREVRDHSAGLRDDAAALAETLRTVRKQVTDAHDDLKFEAETLGNSQVSEERLQPSGTSVSVEAVPGIPTTSVAIADGGARPLAGYETPNSITNSAR